MVRELKLFRWVVPMTSKQVATRLIAGRKPITWRDFADQHKVEFDY